MNRHALWQDEYWLLLMQLYLKKPEGVKPLYSKAMVKLALELHIPPAEGRCFLVSGIYHVPVPGSRPAGP